MNRQILQCVSQMSKHLGCNDHLRNFGIIASCSLFQIHKTVLVVDFGMNREPTRLRGDSFINVPRLKYH